jgi:methyl coenzyme M reductase alpha subunit
MISTAKMHIKKLFIKALNKKFATEKMLLASKGIMEENLQNHKTAYLRLGPDQSLRKREFMEYPKKQEVKRGISATTHTYTRAESPGQRQLVPYKLSSTEYKVRRR